MLSIRIPKNLKERMRRLDVDWRAEIVAFLEQRVRYYEKLKALQEVREILRRHAEVEEGTAAAFIREDRDDPLSAPGRPQG